jgi:hypothetical protein
MAERDAFGREKDEDPLAAMGWRGDAPAAPPAPVPARADAAAPAPPAAPPELVAPPPQPTVAPPTALPSGAAPPRALPAPRPRRPPRRRGPSLARLIIGVTVLGALLVGVSAVYTAGRHAVDGVRRRIEAVAVPSGLQARSLYRPGPLRVALAKVPGRIVYLRVAADRIDAQAVRRGTGHNVQVRYDGTVTDTALPADPRPALVVDVNAPARIVRTIQRRAGSAPTYLVLGAAAWQAFTDTRHYTADVAGRQVRRVD